MISFELDSDQREFQELAREFARRELPALASDADAGRHDSAAYMRLQARAAGAGLHAMLIGEQHGGAGRGCLDNVIVQEELGAVDVGLGGSLNLTMCVPLMLELGAAPEQASEWLAEIAQADDHVLAGALNEPDVAGSELFCPLPDTSLGVRTRARRDGDRYVLNGAKAAFVTNAAVAKAFMIFARTDPDVPAAAGVSAFYVPAATPGLSTGAPTALMGMRSSWHAEVVLDDVEIGAERRIGDEGGALALMGGAAAPMALGLAAGFVGLARTARDLAVDYAKTRTSWGAPIAEHQAVALHLADMDTEVRAARLLVWHAAAAVDAGDPEAMRAVPAAKAHAVDAAIRVAEHAVKVLGGYGVSPEYPVEKLLRDAWTGWSCDFTGDMLRLQVAQAL